MNVITYSIEFGVSTYKGNVGIFPFTCVLQTNSKKIEKACGTQWPKLMTHQQYTTQDNLDKYKMIKYIKDNLTTSDIKDIHKLAYDKGWFTPFEISDNISTCELQEFNCKIWSDPNIPYLELKGLLKLDIVNMLQIYIKKNWITFETDSGILSEKPRIRFNKSLPFIVRYNSSQTPLDLLLKEIIKQANTKNSVIDKFLVSKTKLKNIAEYKKELTWAPDKQSINIEIKEKVRLLKDKALADPIKYGLLGLGVNQLTKDLKPTTKKKLGLAAYLLWK
jgi:hypothetical protein